MKVYAAGVIGGLGNLALLLFSKNAKELHGRRPP
jgi:hypothetical protein